MEPRCNSKETVTQLFSLHPPRTHNYAPQLSMVHLLSGSKETQWLKQTKKIDPLRLKETEVTSIPPSFRNIIDKQKRGKKEGKIKKKSANSWGKKHGRDYSYTVSNNCTSN